MASVQGATVRDVSAQDFINKYALYLQRQAQIEVPGFVEVVKTSSSKELPPQDSEGWFYKRSASIARTIYLNKNVGVGRLNKRYGSTKNNGVRPSHHKDGSGSVNRKVLQALEKLGVVEQSSRGGRRISEKGQRDLDRIASELAKQIREDESDEEADE